MNGKDHEEKFNNSFKMFVLLVADFVIPCAYNYFYMFRKEIDEVGNLLNTIWQSAFFILLSIFAMYYLLIFAFLLIKRRNLSQFKELYPFWTFVLFSAYLIIWGSMVFYPHTNKVEMNYYISSFMFCSGVWGLTFIIWLVCRRKEECETASKKIVGRILLTTIITIVYTLYVQAVENYDTPFTQPVKFNTIRNEDFLMLITISAYSLSLIVIFFAIAVCYGVNNNNRKKRKMTKKVRKIRATTQIKQTPPPPGRFSLLYR